MKKEKNKKLKNKILKSYIAIIAIIMTIVALVFTVLSERYLINQTRLELKKESKIVAQLLKTERLNSLSKEDPILERRLSVAGRTIDSNMLIIDKKNKIVYESIKEEDKEIIEEFKANKTLKEKYLAEKYDIYDQNGVLKGKVVLFIRLKFADELNSIFRRSLLISMTIGLSLSLIIGLILSKSITNPILKLKNKMQNISFDQEDLSQSIKTRDEIEELEKTFIDMAKKLKHKEDFQKAFFQNSSHELKTPLMSIQGYAEAIKDGIVEPDEMDESLDIIINESKRLKEIVDEIMYLGNLEREDKEVNLSQEKLNEVIHWAIESVNSLAISRNIKIDNQVNKTIIGLMDSQKLHRALVNILGNAIRYANKIIKIECKVEHKYIKIIISDDGIGFKDGEEEKIFERFYKGQKGSSGLGLAITKAIIELHSGRIRAYNNQMNGASIEISLPII